MEQINASNTMRLRKLCRLCGFNGYGGTDILENTTNCENSIPSRNELSEKIFKCIGIHVSNSFAAPQIVWLPWVDKMLILHHLQVKRNDKLPTKICQSCVDKIDEFVQFRELCAATETELRILLELPNEEHTADAEPVFAKEVQDISVQNWLQNVVPNEKDAVIILSDAET